MKRIPGLEGGVGGEVAGGVLLGGAEDAGAPLLVAALGRRPGRARRRSHLPWRGLEETLGGWIPAWFVGVVAGSELVKTRGVRWWLGCGWPTRHNCGEAPRQIWYSLRFKIKTILEFKFCPKINTHFDHMLEHQCALI